MKSSTDLHNTIQKNLRLSLDVISLYTKVPADPVIDIISEHIISKNLYCHKLTATDIHQLLSIIVDNTYFTYNGNTYKQITGLPMPSSISGILAISYMDQLKRRALSHLPIMHILHKIYRGYTHVDIIQRRSHRHIWEILKHR